MNALERRRLLRWGRQSGRRFLWRTIDDPYQIVVTELMLVRTNADQVARVWPRFFESYPTLRSLNEAPPSDVRSLLHPLGLEWRADRIKEFAAEAAKVGDWWTQASELPGGGPYVTGALAVAMRGHGRLPVDTTIARVLVRFYGIRVAGEGRRTPAVLEAARGLGDSSRAFFHAFLDVAALVCLPHAPRCSICPLQSACVTSQAASDVRARRPGRARPLVRSRSIRWNRGS